MEPPDDLFAGVSYYAVGVSPKVDNFIQQYGASKLPYLTDLVTHVIVGVGSHSDPDTLEAVDLYDRAAHIIDESWVISCILSGRQVSPRMFASNKMKMFSRYNVTFTGLSQSDKRALWFMLSHHGAACSLVLESNINLLIAGSASGAKYQRAMEFEEMVVVTPDWVVQCVETGHHLNPLNFHPTLLIDNEQNDSFMDDNSNFSDNCSSLKLEPLDASGEILPPLINEKSSPNSCKKGSNVAAKFVRANIQFFHSGQGAPPPLAERRRCNLPPGAISGCDYYPRRDGRKPRSDKGKKRAKYHTVRRNTRDVNSVNLAVKREIQEIVKTEPNISVKELINESIPEDRRVPVECCRLGCKFLLADYAKYVTDELLASHVLNPAPEGCNCYCHILPEEAVLNINKFAFKTGSSPRLEALLKLQQFVNRVGETESKKMLIDGKEIDGLPTKPDSNAITKTPAPRGRPRKYPPKQPNPVKSDEASRLPLYSKYECELKSPTVLVFRRIGRPLRQAVRNAIDSSNSPNRRGPGRPPGKPKKSIDVSTEASPGPFCFPTPPSSHTSAESPRLLKPRLPPPDPFAFDDKLNSNVQKRNRVQDDVTSNPRSVDSMRFLEEACHEISPLCNVTEVSPRCPPSHLSSALLPNDISDCLPSTNDVVNELTHNSENNFDIDGFLETLTTGNDDGGLDLLQPNISVSKSSLPVNNLHQCTDTNFEQLNDKINNYDNMMPPYQQLNLPGNVKFDQFPSNTFNKPVQNSNYVENAVDLISNMKFTVDTPEKQFSQPQLPPIAPVLPNEQSTLSNNQVASNNELSSKDNIRSPSLVSANDPSSSSEQLAELNTKTVEAATFDSDEDELNETVNQAKAAALSALGNLDL